MDAAEAAPTSKPAPGPAATGNPGRLARALDLVRKLIDFGKQIAATILQGSGATALAAYPCNFGTSDIELIVRRITQGLLRAQALEARLARIAPRLDAKPKANPSPRKPRAAPAAREAEPADFLLAHLPTPEQIAAKVRRQPIGAVFADICRDLGIMPCHPLWRELRDAIMFLGGSLARLVKDILERPYPRDWLDAVPVPWPAPAIPPPAPAGTGPP